VDPFSYIIVLTSIILGLGVTRLVGGLGHLLQTRKRRRPYWVHTLWMVNLLLATAIIWWMTFRWRVIEHWTFFLFLFLLLTPTLHYLISSLLFPDQEEETIADWQTYFFDNNRVVFSLYALVFPNRHPRHISQGHGARSRAGAVLLDHDDALVHALSYRRSDQEPPLSRYVCRVFSRLQSRVRRSHCHHRSNRARRAV
jgi:hypothetical protein